MSDAGGARARRRDAVATGVLVLWIAALGWYAKRLYLRPEAERLAAATRTLPPGPAYYSVWSGEDRIGWARGEIDTLPGGDGFRLTDHLEVDLSALGFGGELTVNSRAEIGPALGLRWFELSAGGVPGEIEADGRVEGDSLLELTVRQGGTPVTRRVPIGERVVLATALPLRIAAEGADVRPGERYRLRTFDPMTLGARDVTVEIAERDLRSYPDSAVPDPASEGWRAARRDTVLAWKVEREMEGLRVSAWIDEDGRFLEIETGSGIRLERTAFELAFYPWRERRR